MKRKIELSARRMTLLFVALSLLSILCSAAAFSQTDAFSAVITGSSKKGGQGEQIQNSKNHSTSPQNDQTRKEGTPPHHLGATNGTIGSQAGQETVITGANTAGAVRVENLANLKSLLIILASGVEIFAITLGSVLVIRGLTRRKIGRIVWGIGWIALGLATPGFVNLAFASARDAIIFSHRNGVEPAVAVVDTVHYGTSQVDKYDPA